MVKADEEKKTPGPDWNRRLKHLLIFEIIAALAGLALFYGYLESRPAVTLTGLAIVTSSRPLAEVDGNPASRPPAAGPAVLPGNRPSPEEPGLPAKAVGEPAGADENPAAAVEELPAPAENGEAGSEQAPAAASPAAPEPPASLREASGPGPETASAPSSQLQNQIASSPAVASSPRPPVSTSLIEVGDFVLPDRRTAALNRLGELGIAVTVTERVVPTPMYRVYLGPFADGKEALAMRAISRRLGDQPFLERRPEGYFLIVSSFYLKSNVEAWLRKYHRAGYELLVTRDPLPIKHSFLLVDAARAGFSPGILLEQLHRAGFPKARRCPPSLLKRIE